MSDPKRHHYVPKMLLKRFVDNNGNLWVYRKDSSDQKVFPAKPDNVFLETDLYTQFDQTGTKDTSVEKQFSTLEGQADLVIEKIITQARSGRQPSLTLGEKKTWDEFLYCQWIRVPQMYNDTIADESFLNAVRDAENSLGPMSDETRADIFQKKEILKKSAWVRAAGMPFTDDSDVLEILEKKGLCIAVIRNPKKSFIIGSLPVRKVTPPGHTDLSDPHVEALLPISHDVIVTPAYEQGLEKIIEMNDGNYIRELNKQALAQSDAIAGRARALIESLDCAR